MTNYKKSITLIAACLMAGGMAFSQDADFDLDSQRSESQDVLPVPGQKVDHEGIVINPTPQEMNIDNANHLDITAGLSVKDKKGKFDKDLDFINRNSKGVKLTVDFGGKNATRNGVASKSGSYVLRINEDGIQIIGRDERGAFYGIQTLKQILSSPISADGKLPYMSINDYPDLDYRGVVEGFYGTPWSHEVRMSLIEFYGKFKMNAYLYGPKDDPYHSSPNWRLPYPEDEAKDIKELIETSKLNRVDFVWAIHPGQDIKWNDEDYRNLVNKFEMMYDLGVRSFAIFFDDISGEGTNPVKQVELLNRLTRDFVKAKGDVSPLIVCPTDYSRLWANPTENGALSIYGKSLDPSINVFWTGDVVCSDLTAETLDWINSRIKRPAYYWWNYPVTDYVRNIILQGPVYGLDTTLTSDNLCGFVSNPMEHGEASKLALYGVADYTWNIASYNPIDNWERGLQEMVPDAAEAYRTFAIHSCDTETGYRRDESWETETFRMAEWDDALAAKLAAEFQRIEAVPQIMENTCSNHLLLDELRPWLVEFGKLGARGNRAIDLIEAYKSGCDDSEFWNAYIANVMTDDERKAYEAHKSGTMKLQPFYENAMDDLATAFLTKLNGEAPVSYRGIGSFANSKTTLTKLMFDNDSTTHYTSGVSQQAGDWIGVDLGKVIDVNAVSILQGRNSVDDVDYFDHAALECSSDGKAWTALIPDMTKQYVINWTGDGVRARYVRLKRLDSEKTNYAAVRSFEVNPLTAANVGFAIEADDVDGALLMFDQRLDTSHTIDGALSFDVADGVTGYTLLLDKLLGGEVRVMQLAADGTVLGELTVDNPFIDLDLLEGASRIKIAGNVRVVEIIPAR